MQGESLIHFDFTKKCSTTGWQNNCGLNSLTHFFAYKVETGEIQDRMSEHPSYTALLYTFQTYYGLQNLPTWDDIKELFERYPVPTDREAIFAPVLRKYLETVLTNKADELWDFSVAAAITDMLTDGRVHDIAIPIYHANKAKFDEIKLNYIRALRELAQIPVTQEEAMEAKVAYLLRQPPVENPNHIQIASHVTLSRKNQAQELVQAQAREYWLATGAKRYAAYIGNLDSAQAISSDELRMLGQDLEIGLEIYTRDSIAAARSNLQVASDNHGAQMSIGYPHVFKFRVYNTRPTEAERRRNGIKHVEYNHWEFEHPEENAERAALLVAAHNEHYPTRLTSAFVKGAKSGQFKLYSNVRVNYRKVLTDVTQSMNEIQTPLLISMETLADMFRSLPPPIVTTGETLQIPATTILPPPLLAAPTTTDTKQTSTKPVPPPRTPRTLTQPAPKPAPKLPQPLIPPVTTTTNPPLILSGGKTSSGKQVLPPPPLPLRDEPVVAPTPVVLTPLQTIDQHFSADIKRVARAVPAVQPLLVQGAVNGEMVELLNRMSEKCATEVLSKVKDSPKFAAFSEPDKLRFFEQYTQARVAQLEKANKHAEAEAYKLRKKSSRLTTL